LARQIEPALSEHTIPDDGVGFSAENWCVMPKLGNQLYLAIDAGPIHERGRQLIAVVETLRDMPTEAGRNRLKTLAASDGLTGLANRRSFDQTAGDGMGARGSGPKAAVAAAVRRRPLQARHDLHEADQKGDECLRAVAGAISKNAFRPADLSARYGGEEFAIIHAGDRLRRRAKAGRALRDVLARHRLPHGAPGVPPFVTLSIGIATQVPLRIARADWLLGQADQALYAAKYSGRNQVVSPTRCWPHSPAQEILRDDTAADASEPAAAVRKACREKIRLALFQSVASIAI